MARRKRRPYQKRIRPTLNTSIMTSPSGPRPWSSATRVYGGIGSTPFPQGGMRGDRPRRDRGYQEQEARKPRYGGARRREEQVRPLTGHRALPQSGRPGQTRGNPAHRVGALPLGFPLSGFTSIRGRVGDRVYKRYGDRIIVTRMPRFDGYEPTPAQPERREKIRVCPGRLCQSGCQSRLRRRGAGAGTEAVPVGGIRFAVRAATRSVCNRDGETGVGGNGEAGGEREGGGGAGNRSAFGVWSLEFSEPIAQDATAMAERLRSPAVRWGVARVADVCRGAKRL